MASFKAVDSWIIDMEESMMANEEKSVILVGNKIDMAYGR